jgi:arylsulfatase A-like enzyme/tetratricopeptide (TPR) repeat protein
MIVSLVLSKAKRPRLWFVVSGFLAFTGLGAAYWYWKAPRLNVVLVTFDTTRADRLGAYGYRHGQTEPFDQFAGRGVVFERAYAPAPVTLPSHATMLTGLYPPEHGLRANGIGRLERHIPLLPEILKKQGYDTAAFIAAVVLDSQFGLDRGFDTYDDDLSQSKSAGHFGERRRDGEDVMASALSWVGQRRERPFFCWIHLYDAHIPYDSRPEVFGQTFAENPYDAGVAWEAWQFERLTAFLKNRGLDDKTLVVVAGDHGEGLGDHLELEHGMLVYDTTLRVPLVFAGPPQCQPGTRVPTAVSLADLTPTVLDILGIAAPKHLSGRSLLAALEGKPIPSRDYYAETESPFIYNRWSPLKTLISGRWKFIETTRPELYDLENDPGEQINLAESDDEECQKMRKALADMQAAFIVATALELTPSDKDRAKLEALGYVGGGNLARDARELKGAERLPDVKDMLVFLGQFETARNISLEGRLEESIAILQGIVLATDKFPAAELLLGDCLAQDGRLDDAVTTYRSVLAHRPDFVKARLNLGKVFSSLGRFEDAVVEFREFIEQNPDAAPCHFELAQAQEKLERYEEAVSEYREAVRISPEFFVANIHLGQLLTTLKRPQEAAACFEEALEYAPRSASAHANLMIVLAQTGRHDQAIEHGKTAVALEPTSFDARFNLGILLVAQGQYADGMAELREAQRLRPDDPRPRQQIERAEAALNKGDR